MPFSWKYLPLTNVAQCNNYVGKVCHWFMDFSLFLSSCFTLSWCPTFSLQHKSLHDNKSNPTCICALFPAVILEIVQHASFRMLSLELLSKCKRLGSALQFRITYQLKAKLVVIKITGILQMGKMSSIGKFCPHLQ